MSSVVVSVIAVSISRFPTARENPSLAVEETPPNHHRFARDAGMPRPMLALLFLIALTPSLFAQKELVWGGDKAGGAPYIFDDEDLNQVGFETELAAYLAKKLGREPRFQQVDWDVLPDVLKSRKIDIVLNGYEYNEQRGQLGNCSLPYYVYKLRLIVHRDARTKDGAPIQSWEQILGSEDDKEKRNVAVLKGSMAQQYLTAHYGDRINILANKDVAEMLALLQQKRIDATVQDSPAAQYYITEGNEYPQLKVVGEPVGYGLYVILTHPDDEKLRGEIDAALRDAFTTGELEKILRKYRLWNIDQQRLSYFYHKEGLIRDAEISDEAQEQGQGVTAISFSKLIGPLFRATWLTLALAFVAMPIAILLGIILALGRLYGPWPIRIVAGFIVELFRGTPLLLQIFFWFFTLPELFLAMGLTDLHAAWTAYPFLIGVFGLAMNYSASEAENYRAGLQAIPKGQMEAALALGMTRGTAIRRILLPQALRIVIPPVTNDFIALLKDTSICSMILVTELTGLYHIYKTNPSIAPQLALTVAIIYLCLSYPLAVAARRLERKLG